MDRASAIAALKSHQSELERLGVEHLYLFGSTVRDEAREDSDVDLFFDHPEGSLGLFALIDVKEAERLASNVDALKLALRGISNSDTKLR